MQLFSQPAANRSPEQIAKDLIKKTFPDTRTAYLIPNAMVGYHPGYGEAADLLATGLQQQFTLKMRVLVMVAVKNDLALVARGGPFRAFGPDSGSGKPSGASLQIRFWTWANTSTAFPGGVIRPR